MSNYIKNYYLIKNKFNQIEKKLFNKAININTYIEIKINDYIFNYSFVDLFKEIHILPIDFKYYTKSYYTNKYIFYKLNFVNLFINSFNQFYNTNIFTEIFTEYINYIISLNIISSLFIYLTN